MGVEFAFPHRWTEVAELLRSDDPDDVERAVAFLDDRDRALEDALGGAVQAGTTTETVDGSGEATVTFPEAYGSPPIVVANSDTTWAISIVAITAADFTFLAWDSLFGPATGDVTIYWIASNAT